MAVVRCDVFLVPIAIRRHCVPGPGGVPSDSVDVIPVILGTCIVYHVIWVDSEDENGFTTIRNNSLLIELDPPKILPRE